MSNSSRNSISPETPWYFGELSREEENLLLKELDPGTFVVRDSTRSKGSYVLTMKEKNVVNRYLITYIPEENDFQFGTNRYSSVQSIIDSYQTMAVSKYALSNPAPKSRYIAIADYIAQFPNEFTVKKGEILNFINRKGDFIICDKTGKHGLVPLRFLKEYDPHGEFEQQLERRTNCMGTSPRSPCVLMRQCQLPAHATVVEARTPSIFNEKDLPLKVADIVIVQEIYVNGKCEVFHERLNRVGLVPFSFLRIEQKNRNTGSFKSISTVSDGSTA